MIAVQRAWMIGLLVSAACGSSDMPFESAPKTPVQPTTPVPASTLVPGAPAGWSGTSGGGYEVGIDTGSKRTGSSSAYLRSTSSAANAAAVIVQSIRADDYRGKRVRLRGYGKTTNVSGDGFGFWIRVDGPSRSIWFDNMLDRRVSGTTDWTNHALVVDVPANAVGIALGALVVGTGEARIDDLVLETVGTEVAVTGGALTTSYDSATTANSYARTARAPVNLNFEGLPPIPGSTATWLRSAAIPFATDDPTASLDDLEPIRAIVGDARMVSLGEGTHGTREFFRMKHRIFEFLVERMGFTAFAIEATAPESDDVDLYVRTGVGNPSALLARLYFWTWNTDEVLDLINWMREYNRRAGTTKVRFLGFDMQYPGAAMDSVTSFISRVDAPLLPRVTALYGCLGAYRNLGTRSPNRAGYTALPLSVRESCRDSVNAAHALFAARRSAWEANSSTASYVAAEHHARLVAQWEESARTNDSGSRDRSMAENASWILDQLGPGGRVMLWAHNGHVVNLPSVMGGALRAKHGRSYLNAGFLFGTGGFNAIEFTSSGTSLGLRSLSIGSIEPNTFESVFAATGMPRLILDTRRVREADGAPLVGPLRMRSIGSGYYPTIPPITWYTPVILPDDYDMLIWFSSASASRLRPF
jgi:erythromycin esterase